MTVVQITKKVGLRILRRRLEIGMTQTALAEAVGMTQSAISMIERQKNLPGLNTLVKISDVLTIGMDVLVMGEDELNKRKGTR